MWVKKSTSTYRTEKKDYSEFLFMLCFSNVSSIAEYKKYQPINVGSRLLWGNAKNVLDVPN